MATVLQYLPQMAMFISLKLLMLEIGRCGLITCDLLLEELYYLTLLIVLGNNFKVTGEKTGILQSLLRAVDNRWTQSKVDHFRKNPEKTEVNQKELYFLKLYIRSRSKKTVRTTQKGCEITVLNQKSSVEMNNLPFISA